MLNKLKVFYEQFGIIKQILVVVLLVSVIPMVCLILITQNTMGEAMKKQTKELIVSNLKQSASHLDSFIEYYDNIIKSVYTNQEYADQLEKINTWDSKDYYSAKNWILNTLRDICYVNQNLLGAAIISNNEEILYHDTFTQSTRKSIFFDKDILRLKQIIEREITPTDTTYSKTYYSEVKEGEGVHYFYIIHRLIDFNHYKKGGIGYIVLCVPEKKLRESYYQEEIPQSNVSILINQQGDILSFIKEELIGENIYKYLNQDRGEVVQVLEKYLKEKDIMKYKNLEVNYQSIRDGKFILVNIQDMDYALADVNKMVFIVMLSLVSVMAISVFIIFVFSKNMDQKVRIIINAMKRVDMGDYNVLIFLESEDEFGQIATSFNRMIHKVKVSIEQEKEAMKREKDAEIRSLEAQINPHFLYNTLDAINWIALDQGAFLASKMLTSLGTILRYSIKNSNEIVSLKIELQYLREYICLQQRRFQYLFECELDIEEDLLHYQVHKLLLQPLVENTIEHGFPGNQEQNEIKIQIRKEDNYLIFLISDNGCGMSLEKVEYFNHYDYRKDKVGSSIGICNVITRIKLYYGEESKFYILSNDRGTQVRFKIPCIEID